MTATVSKGESLGDYVHELVQSDVATIEPGIDERELVSRLRGLSPPSRRS